MDFDYKLDNGEQLNAEYPDTLPNLALGQIIHFGPEHVIDVIVSNVDAN